MGKTSLQYNGLENFVQIGLIKTGRFLIYFIKKKTLIAPERFFSRFVLKRVKTICLAFGAVG